MNLLQDTPITSINDDLFGRGAMVDLIVDSINNVVSQNHPCIVYGIYGEWGNGKTSLMNFIKTRLISQGKGDGINIVEFNPWLVNNSETLLQEFFKTIIEDDASAVRHAIKKYGAAVKFASKYILTPFVPGVGDAVTKGVSWMQKILDDQQDTLAELKRKTSEAIINSNKHLIILIDDVDRLDKEELHTLLRLVRQMADFDNCIYLLSMDEDMVSKSIGTFYGKGATSDGRKFLEKIVQIPIKLPKIPRHDMNKIVFGYLKTTLKDYSDDVNIQKISNDVSSSISTMRDLKRYCNQLTFVLPHLKDEVNIKDLCILESIKIVSTEAYNRIYESRKLLMHQIDIIDSINNKEKAHEIAEENYKNAKRYVIEDIPYDEAKVIDTLLDLLFINSSYDSQIDLDDKRINTDVYFPKYFALTVPSNLLPDTKIETLLPAVKSRYKVVVRNQMNTWIKQYPPSEIKRASLYLIRFFENGVKKANAASVIAQALSTCELSKRYPPFLNIDDVSLSSFISISIIHTYLFDVESSKSGSKAWYSSILDNTYSYIFQKSELNFCMNLLCSSDVIFNSGSYDGKNVLPIIIDRFQKLDFDNDIWLGKDAQFRYSKLLLNTLFTYWKRINIDSFNLYANDLFDNRNIPYLKVMYKFMDGENDIQDVHTFVNLFEDQVSIISKRLKEEGEIIHDLHHVKLFLINYEQILKSKMTIPLK